MASGMIQAYTEGGRLPLACGFLSALLLMHVAG